MSEFKNFLNDPARGTLRRILVFGGGGLLIALVFIVSRWASAPVYVTLYRDLDLKDSAELEQSLEQVAIPHKLAGGGTEIEVPVSDLARARVALARDGHTVGNRPGMELFDKPSWGMTDFAQRVTFQRALEGELARTIAGLKGVEQVQVHLALPPESPFRQDQRKASASVVLGLASGAELAPETIHGIVYIVSNSVEGLEADHVAVMDGTGRVLSAPAGEDGLAGTSLRQLDMQRAAETACVEKIQNLLEPILGAGRVRAEVTAELSFDKVDRAVESTGPYGDGDLADAGDASDGGSDAGDGTAAGDDPSAASADAAGAGAGGAGGVGAGGPAEAGRGYNGRAIERREGAVGQLKRLTAAVLIEETALGADEAARTARLSGIENLVKNAIGIDERRGDRLSLSAVPFAAAKTPEAAEAIPAPKGGADLVRLVERMVRPVVGLVALIVLLVLAMRVLRLPLPAAAPIATPAALGANGYPAGTGLPGGEALAANGRPPAEADDPDRRIRVLRGWLKGS